MPEYPDYYGPNSTWQRTRDIPVQGFDIDWSKHWTEILAQLTRTTAPMDLQRKKLLLDFMTGQAGITGRFTSKHKRLLNQLIEMPTKKPEEFKGLLTQLRMTPEREKATAQKRMVEQKEKTATQQRMIDAYMALYSGVGTGLRGQVISAPGENVFLKTILGEITPSAALQQTWPSMNKPEITPENFETLLPTYKRLHGLEDAAHRRRLGAARQQRGNEGMGFLGELLRPIVKGAVSAGMPFGLGGLGGLMGAGGSGQPMNWENFDWEEWLRQYGGGGGGGGLGYSPGFLGGY